MRHLLPRAALALALLGPAAARAQVQEADTSFHPAVARPAYPPSAGPRVLFDEAHLNFHTAGGRYKPFVDLLAADGYRVTPSREPFSAATLAGHDVLVIANASAGQGLDALRDRGAFAAAEIEAVHAWVAGGGALLLIADHTPFGRAAREMGERFGVRMSEGYTGDPVHYDTASNNQGFIVYTRERGLADHALTRGRGPDEAVRRVIAFTGQSLLGPPGSTALLVLSDSAFDRPPPPTARMEAVLDSVAALRAAGDTAARLPPIAPGVAVSAAGRAQAVALEVGRGRVVVLGEAAMLSAQVITRPDGTRTTMGMNRPGTDNARFALNLMHWLTRLLR